ncbi:MAG: shikimate 5-dehydrogenase [Verrucomicrobiales bacterium]|jgi:shikimate 5-dehydrogenase
MIFIGVTTRQSSIIPVFPKWATALGLGDAVLEGMDFVVHDDPARYREAVAFIKNSPLAMGALVTTHKMDLFTAASDLFDEIDPLSRSMGEISSIFKRDGKLCGRTVDPMNGGKALAALLPDHYWKAPASMPSSASTASTASTEALATAEVCILGAGGAGIALSWHLAQPGQNNPQRIHVTDRDPAKLAHMQKFHSASNTSRDCIHFHLCQSATDNDQLVSELPAGSLIINATGLGKDAPGSPLTCGSSFPQNAIAWDLNYRGNLLFLDQARSRADVQAVDGWQYFIYGWSSVIADVFHLAIPDGGAQLAELARLAEACRA